MTALWGVFPSRFAALIFVTYIGLFVGQGVFIRASQSGGSYPFNKVIVVLLTEALKLVLAAGLWLRECVMYRETLVLGLQTADLLRSLLPVRHEGDWAGLRDAVLRHRRQAVQYVLPAVLYCAYNNLAFVNLQHYDPPTYYVLLQFRVVIVGVLYQVLFKRILSGQQWIALLLLTVGCILKEWGARSASASASFLEGVWNPFLGLLVIQMFCSVFAGIYNEYLLKGRSTTDEPVVSHFGRDERGSYFADVTWFRRMFKCRTSTCTQIPYSATLRYWS